MELKILVVGPDFIVKAGQNLGIAKTGFVIKTISSHEDLSIYFPTVANASRCAMQLRNKKFEFTINETCGMELGGLTPNILDISDMIIMLFSIHSKNTFEILQTSIVNGKGNLSKHTKILVGITDPVCAGTKREVTASEAYKFAESIKAIDYQECSINHPEKIYRRIFSHLSGMQIPKVPAFFTKHFYVPPADYRNFIADEIPIVAQGRRQPKSSLSTLPGELLVQILKLVGGSVAEEKILEKIIKHIFACIPIDSKPKVFKFAYAKLENEIVETKEQKISKRFNGRHTI